jgi:hypothetical protein
MNINAYLEAQYASPPCWQLVAAVYANERGQSVTDYKTINSSVRAIASAMRIALHKSPNGFVQIEAPVDYCVVLMGKSTITGLHHCGVYYDGKVLHGLDSGNRYEEISVIGDAYQLIEFWARA